MMTWQVHHLSGHEQAVNGLCLLPGLGGKSLVAASGSKDGQIRLWDLSSSGECMASLNLPPGSGVSGLATATNTAQPTAGGASGQSPAGEGTVKLYASTTSGHVHAIGVDGLGEIGGDLDRSRRDRGRDRQTDDEAIVRPTVRCARARPPA